MKIFLYFLFSFLCLQRLPILRYRWLIGRSELCMCLCVLCECEFGNLQWHFSYVLVLTLKAWKALWRARWTNPSPGVGPSRTCTEGATCPPPWATVHPAREDILHCGEFLQSGGRHVWWDPLGQRGPGCCWGSWAGPPHLATQACISNDSKWKVLQETIIACGHFTQWLQIAFWKHHAFIQKEKILPDARTE